MNIQGLPVGPVTDVEVDTYITSNDVDLGDITTATDVTSIFANGVTSCL